MAELEARFAPRGRPPRMLWRQPLPEDREVSIGRIPLTLAEVAPENRAEWVTDKEDTFVSGCHAYVRWAGGRLHVRVRTHPRRPTNPIFYRGEPADEFTLPPGEGFTIGNTLFLLHAGTLAESIDEETGTAVQPTHFHLAPEDLRDIVFNDTAHVFKALSRFPELIRYSRDDSTRDDHLLKLVRESLRQADVAAIVVGDPLAAEFRVAVRRVNDFRPTREAAEFRPSQRLSRRALKEDLENTLHVRGQRLDSKMTDVTLDAGVDWAICTPLVQDGGLRLGLYVAGHLRGVREPDASGPPPELSDYQKVIGLAAQIYASAYELRQAEKQLTRYQSFLSRTAVTLLNSANAEDLLKPKEAVVTVLFCDLRGSCRLAEQGAEDLLGNWARISQALDLMTTAITDEGGVIGDLQGDAAMGFWGWPLEQPDNILRAARAALRIQRDFARGKGGQREYSCGIGLAHGKAVAGRLGTFDQIKLDVFGPVVNLAARLESLTKTLGVSILMDGPVTEALRAVDPAGTQQFQSRPIGTVLPAGMTVPAVVSELVPPATYSDKMRALWQSGTSGFAAGRWNVAREKLEQYAVLSGSDKAAELLRTVMDRVGDKAPDGWDGVIRLEQK